MPIMRKEEEIDTLKAKLADLEDWARRNNVKFRGVSEMVLLADLHRYIQQLISTLLPDIPHREVIVNRAHRLPKPNHLPDNVPCDIFARIHFYHIKDELMQSAR